MSKGIYRVMFFAVIVLGTVGCGKNTPEKVAKTWLVSFNRMDIEPAIDLSTAPTKNLLNTMYELTSGLDDSSRGNLSMITVDIKSVKSTDSTAVVTYNTSDNSRERKLNLVKQSDKWLVEFTKVDLANEALQIDLPTVPPPVTDSSYSEVEIPAGQNE